MLTTSDISVFERLVSVGGAITPSNAQAVLSFRFTDSDHAVIRELSEKANFGTLNAQEQELLESYVSIGDLLTVLHARAEDIRGPKASNGS